MVSCVSSLAEIEEAIAKLPDKDFRVLLARLRARDAEAWDRQIEGDGKSGRLDALYARLAGEDEASSKVPLDEVLDDREFS